MDGDAVVALVGVDHALEALQGTAAAVEGLAERSLLAEDFGALYLADKDLSFDNGESAEGPGGADEGVDLVAMLGECGLEALVVFGGESVELGVIFAGDDEGLGVDAGFQGIHGGAGLALSGAGSRGLVGHKRKWPALWGRPLGLLIRYLHTRLG